MVRGRREGGQRGPAGGRRVEMEHLGRRPGGTPLTPVHRLNLSQRVGRESRRVHQTHLMYHEKMEPTREALTPPAFVGLAAHSLRWRLLTTLADSDYRVRELVALFGEPQNLLSYHLRQLRDGGLVTARRSSNDGRDTYYHLDLDRCAEALAETAAALHPALGRKASVPPAPAGRELSRPVAVLFVCTGNSIRSPI